jgi:multidrug efflux pump
MGLVIASGMAIGTLFTLFVVPMFYTYLASDKRPAAEAVPAAPHGETLALPAPAE